MKITYQSGTLNNQTNSGEWSFDSNQGAEFMITVSANLVGGYQQLVWSKLYKTLEGKDGDYFRSIIIEQLY